MPRMAHAQSDPSISPIHQPDKEHEVEASTPQIPILAPARIDSPLSEAIDLGTEYPQSWPANEYAKSKKETAELKNLLESADRALVQSQMAVIDLCQRVKAMDPRTYTNNSFTPYFAGEVSQLAVLHSQFNSLPHAQRGENLRQQLAISRQVLGAIQENQMTGNIQNLYIAAGEEHLTWCEQMFGDPVSFARFIRCERDLFENLGLSPTAVRALSRTLEEIRVKATGKAQVVDDAEFEVAVNKLSIQVDELLKHELTAERWHSALIVVSRTLCATIVVANAVGPAVIPLFSPAFYAASITIGGLGITLTPKE